MRKEGRLILTALICSAFVLDGCKGSSVTAVPGVAEAAAPVTLVRTFKDGEKEKYSMTMDMDQLMGGTAAGKQGMKMNMTSNMEQVVSKVASDGKSADMSMKTSDIAIKTEPALPMGNMLPKEMTTTAKVDSRNQLTDFKMADDKGMSQMLGNGSNPMGYGVVLPDHAVKIGDSWEFPFPKMAMLDSSGTMKATLVGAKSMDGFDCWEIKVSGKIPVKMGKDAGAIGGDMDIDTSVYLDKSNCGMVASKSTIKSKMSMGGAGGKGGMDMSQTMTMSVDLKK